MYDSVNQIRELAERVKRLAEAEGTSVEHVLVVLTTVLLAAPPQSPSATTNPVTEEPSGPLSQLR